MYRRCPPVLNRSTVEVMMTRRSSAVLDDESALYAHNHRPRYQVHRTSLVLITDTGTAPAETVHAYWCAL